MTVNVQPDGTISVDGQPFLWGAWWPRDRYQAILQPPVVALKMPDPFTVPGSPIIFAAGDYLIVDPKTRAFVKAMNAADFAAAYDVNSGVTV